MAVAWNPYANNMYQNSQGVYQNQMGAYGTQQQQQSQIVLPQQQVPQIDGPESINMLRMAPNSSVLLMEKNRAVIWLCMTDSLANVTSIPYDYSPHEDAPAIDVNTMEERLAALEAAVLRLEGMANGNQPDVSRDKSVKGGGNYGKSEPSQTNAAGH